MEDQSLYIRKHIHGGWAFSVSRNGLRFEYWHKTKEQAINTRNYVIKFLFTNYVPRDRYFKEYGVYNSDIGDGAVSGESVGRLPDSIVHDGFDDGMYSLLGAIIVQAARDHIAGWTPSAKERGCEDAFVFLGEAGVSHLAKQIAERRP